MRIGAEKQVRGLFSQLTSDGDHRPADVLVPPSATGGGLHWALDVTITDPTNKTKLERHSDTRALAAATRVHNKKLEIFRRQLEAAGPAGLQFEKKPLALKATGAIYGQRDARVVEGSGEVGHRTPTTPCSRATDLDS